ncbi:shikimate kinase [Ilumatobacter sp.]|uniref:shikimate kinase n=1 Tax=Ilumatobacter sp. TaxID=1967498 RepID=UPI003B52DCE8
MRSTAPHIVIVGRSGVGKSTVGFELSRRLHRPFFDADNHPDRAPEHAGEATDDEIVACRDWIQVICSTSMPAVIAAPWVGVDQVLRSRDEQRWGEPHWIVLLEADDDVLRGRIGERGAPASPAADADADDRLAALRAAAAVEVDTGSHSTSEVVDRVAQAWSRRSENLPAR